MLTDSFDAAGAGAASKKVSRKLSVEIEARDEGDVPGCPSDKVCVLEPTNILRYDFCTEGDMMDIFLGAQVSSRANHHP